MLVEWWKNTMLSFNLDCWQHLPFKTSWMTNLIEREGLFNWHICFTCGFISYLDTVFSVCSTLKTNRLGYILNTSWQIMLKNWECSVGPLMLFTVFSPSESFSTLLSWGSLRDSDHSSFWQTGWKEFRKKTRIEDEDGNNIATAGELDNQSRHKLMSGFPYKLIFARTLARAVIQACQSFELMAFPVFIYRKTPSFFVTCLGLCLPKPSGDLVSRSPILSPW